MSKEILIKKISNTYQLCNKDLNKFALLLRKGIYPYEYMNSRKRFKEESFPYKECRYDELNNKPITDEDRAHAQKLWEVFEKKVFVSIMTYMFNLIHHYLQMCPKTLDLNA